MDKKITFKKPNAKNILFAIVALLCSLLIWVFVTESQGEDITQTFSGVRVVFEGETTMRESRGLIVSETSSNTVKLTVTGSRRTVFNLKAEDLTVAVDLSGISRTGNYSLTPKINFPSKTDTSAITSWATDPDSISFYVDKLSRKTVPVEGEFNGRAADGFSAEPLEFSPSTVVLYGPEKVLAMVDHAFVEVNREDVDKTLSFDSTFVLIDGDGNEFTSDEITTDVDTVAVTLPILAVKEVDLIVDLVPGGGATENNVKWKLEPDSITLTGDSETLAGVNNISLAKIDLSTVDEALTETYKIVIPNDTESTSGVREATLTLEIGGLYKESVSIEQSNISCVNVSEGFTAEIMSDSLDGVILRGPEADVKAISEVNVRAVADLKDYGTATGIVSVPVKITVDGSTTVGAVGEYRIYVNIIKGTGE